MITLLELFNRVLLEECHEKLIMDYNKLHDTYEDAEKKNAALIKSNCDFFNKIVDLQNENYKLKKENEELKGRNDDKKETEIKTLQYKYNVLERKYLDAQRTIDKYAAENEELKKQYMDASNKMNLYKYQSDQLKGDISKSEQHIDERTGKFWKNRYEEANIDRIKLRNKLNVEKVKRENAEKYIVGYQKLYSEECEINRELRKQIGKTPELDALNAMETLVNILNRGKDDATDNKS